MWDQGHGDISRPSHPGLWTSLAYLVPERLITCILSCTGKERKTTDTRPTHPSQKSQAAFGVHLDLLLLLQWNRPGFDAEKRRVLGMSPFPVF